jgi:hypothetical protein
MTYGFAPVEKPRCGICGSAFVTACTRCSTAILNSFLSPGFIGSNEPVYPPDRPENCMNCGHAFPWNSRARRAVVSVSKIPAKIWGEFKGLSALHITLLIILLLVVFGVIKWHDLVEILKAIAGKKE